MHCGRSCEFWVEGRDKNISLTCGNYLSARQSCEYLHFFARFLEDGSADEHDGHGLLGYLGHLQNSFEAIELATECVAPRHDIYNSYLHLILGAALHALRE